MRKNEVVENGNRYEIGEEQLMNEKERMIQRLEK